MPVIDGNENGSGVATKTYQYFDTVGRLRWTKDGEGYVNYTSYHPETGGVAYQVRDVGPDSDINTGSSGKWIPWSGDAPLTRDSDLPDAIELVDKTEFDSQGRVRKRIDVDGNQHYTVYEHNRTIQFPFWDGDNSLTPISVTVHNDAGQTTESFTVIAGYTGVAKPTGEPIGFETEPNQNDHYTTWTRFFYNATNGKLAKTLRYHDIPANGSGSHVTHYYVSATEYDSQGRIKKSIQTSTGNTHQVSENIYDWQGRIVESRQGASSSGINIDPSSTVGTIAFPLTQVASMEYDRGGVGNDARGVGNSWVTSTKTFYGTGAQDFIESRPQHTWRGFVRGLSLIHI